jgi:Fe-S oxidoreductase
MPAGNAGKRCCQYRTTVGGKLKADQIRKSGCDILVAPCANCKKQLRELVEDQGINCQVVGLHDLIYKAIIFDDSLIVKKEGLIFDKPDFSSKEEN